MHKTVSLRHSGVRHGTTVGEMSKEGLVARSPATFRVHLLNGFALRMGVVRAPEAIAELPHGVQRLVAQLSLVGRPPRTLVAGQLWPDAPEDRARASLRSTLWRLQKLVPGLVVACDDALTLAASVRVDVADFTTRAQRVLSSGVDVGGTGAVDLVNAGELLPGWYDDWVLLERERLRQLRMHALESLAEKLSRVGRYAEALEAASASVRAEPLRESAHRALVRVHLAEGNIAEALHAYAEFRSLLARELGVRPTRRMEELIRQATCRGFAARTDHIRDIP